MSPPPKNIVNIMKSVTTFMPGNERSVKPNAEVKFTSSINPVPATALNNEFRYAVPMIPLSNTFR